MLPESLVKQVNDTSYMPPLGEQGISTKLALITNAQGEWQRIWARIRRNHELRRGNLWTDQETRQINASNRLPVELPIIEPMMRNLAGRHAAMRTEWKLVPAPGRTEQLDPALLRKCDLAEMAINGIAQANSWNEKDDGYVDEDACAGIGWAAVQESTTLDGRSELLLTRIDWREMMFDPATRDPELNDCRWLLRCVFRTIPEAIELYPDKQSVLEGWQGKQEEIFRMTGRFMNSGNYTGYDQYLLPIYEFYERRRFLVYTLIDPNSEDAIDTDFYSEEEANQELQNRQQKYELQAAQQFAPGVLNAPPAPMEVSPHWEPRIVQTCFIGTSLLDENMMSSPRFPYVPKFQFFDSGCESLLFWGMIDIVAAPQQFFNRTVSQIDYMLKTATKNFMVYDRDRLLQQGFTEENLREESARTAPQIGVSGDPKDIITMIPQTQIPTDYMALCQLTLNILDKIIPSVAYGPALPGSQGGSPDQSGRAIALQQQVADSSLASLTVRDKFFHQQLGELLLYNLQTNTDEPSIIKYIGKDNAVQWVTLNSTPENSIYDERFIVTVSDQSYSASQRSIVVGQLLDLLQNQAIMQMLASPAVPPALLAILETVIMQSDLPVEQKMKIVQGIMTPPMLPVQPGNGATPPAPQGNNIPMHATADERSGVLTH